MDEKVTKTLQALRAHNIGAQYVEKVSDVVGVLQTMLQQDDTVTLGGSVTLKQCGVPDWLRSSEEYSFLDRDAADADVDEVFHDAFFADWYLSGTNAVTMNGELVNVDGNANRVAALAFGPAHVAIVVGVNKIVENEAAARKRIAQVAAPKNAARLHCETPCAQSGKCENCRAENPQTICCTYLVQGMQRKPGRIQVIMVGEELGY